MNLKCAVTLFVSAVLLLANVAQGQGTSSTTNSNTDSAQSARFNLLASFSRSTSLIDYQDGSRSDAQDISINPSLKYSFGKFSTVIAYSRNLRDPYSRTENDWADVPLSFTYKPFNFQWFDKRTSQFLVTGTLVIPASKYSVKKDELKTALISKLTFVSAPKEGSGISVNTSISLGRNFHSYEEDINGSILNQYSSNQTLSLGYGFENWSLSFDFINKTRWTYQNNVKSSFELTEELGYEINKNISLALGHTNSGSTLKPNGSDSNINLINENSSQIYGTLNLFYE